jgi:hypothetical protein
VQEEDRDTSFVAIRRRTTRHPGAQPEVRNSYKYCPVLLTVSMERPG